MAMHKTHRYPIEPRYGSSPSFLPLHCRLRRSDEDDEADGTNRITNTHAYAHLTPSSIKSELNARKKIWTIARRSHDLEGTSPKERLSADLPSSYDAKFNSVS